MSIAQGKDNLNERGFPFLEINQLPSKPRSTGLTEIRGAYYRPIGPRFLADILEAMGAYVDSYKFGGGVFAIQPRSVTKEIIDLCHAHDVKVSCGGALEHALLRRGNVLELFLEECVDLGFDTVEVSANYINLSIDDMVSLTKRIKKAGLDPKPEISVRFGTGGGTTSIDDLENQGISDVGKAIRLGERCLEAGASLVMVESEGITEDVHEWRTDIASRIVDSLGLENVMFEAADPLVFAHYVRMYGPAVNLFVDYTQIYHMASLRCGVGGGRDLWNRVFTYVPEDE